MGGGGPVVPAFQRSSSLSEPPQTRPGDGFLCVRSFSFEAKKNRKNLRRKRIFLFFFVNFFLFFFCFFYPTRPVHSTLIAPLISLFFISLDDLVFFDFFSFFFLCYFLFVYLVIFFFFSHQRVPEPPSVPSTSGHRGTFSFRVSEKKNCRRCVLSLSLSLCAAFFHPTIALFPAVIRTEIKSHRWSRKLFRFSIIFFLVPFFVLP